MVVFISRLLVFQWVLNEPHDALAYLFLYPYEAYYVHQQKRSRNQQSFFNLTLRYIRDVLSLNNPTFNDHIGVIYPDELEIN